MAILTIFIAVLALCFVHTAMMVSSTTAVGCILSTEQAMCPLQQIMSSWQNLFVALPQINVTVTLLLLVSIIFFVFCFDRQTQHERTLRPLQLYSKTYPNFSSLNFLSYALRSGILQPKVF